MTAADTLTASSASDPGTPETRLRAGDASATVDLFEQYRDRLKRMVRLRLDRRLQGRLDASDVLQEAFLDVQKKAPDFAQKEMPAYLWLRLVVAERLLILHRHHLGAEMRDAGREVSLCRGGLPAASTHSLANLLLGRLTSPTQAAVRAERQLRLQEALNGMDPLDREILALRHFEAIDSLADPFVDRLVVFELHPAAHPLIGVRDILATKGDFIVADVVMALGKFEQFAEGTCALFLCGLRECFGLGFQYC